MLNLLTPFIADDVSYAFIIERVEISKIYDPDPDMPVELYYTSAMFLRNIFYGFLPIIIRESLLFVPIIFYFMSGRKSVDASKFILTFLTASIIILLVMICLPEFPERAGFPANIFLLIASLAAFKEILPELQRIFKRRMNFLNNAAKVLAVFWIFHMAACAYVYVYMYAQLENRRKIIEANRNADEIVVPYLELPSWSEDIVGQRTWTNYAIW